MGEDHGPRDIGRASPKLAVDEIAEASGGEADRDQGRGEIANIQEAFVIFPCKQPQGEEHAEKTAVKGHAALPDIEQTPRRCEEGVELIEQHRADPPAHDHAQGAIEDQTFHLLGGPAGTGAAGAIQAQAPGRKETEHIHQPIPTHMQRAEAEKNRVDFGVGDHGRGPG